MFSFGPGPIPSGLPAHPVTTKPMTATTPSLHPDISTRSPRLTGLLAQLDEVILSGEQDSGKTPAAARKRMANEILVRGGQHKLRPQTSKRRCAERQLAAVEPCQFKHD